ncbi:MAG: DUF4920 domain-containing protein [Deltaproteobacteria bacterium]|nr:DUF4920 domain-containing protein [Deltaproteobacteria bacterium]
MKLVHRLVSTLGIVAALGLAAGACSKKAEEAPPEAAPAKVEAPQEAAPGEPAAEPTMAAAEGPKDEAKAEPAAAPAGGSEADCPFEENHAHADEAAAVAAAEPAGEAAGGCEHGAAPADGVVEGGKLHLGAPFALTEAKSLSAVLTASPDGTTEAVQFTGTIDKVCQAKGCWMVVKDGDKTARIIMKDHAFSVPKDSMGKATTVEGTLTVKTFTEAQVKHLAQDGGEDPNAVQGEQKEYVVTASAVAIGS